MKHLLDRLACFLFGHDWALSVCYAEARVVCLQCHKKHNLMGAKSIKIKELEITL